MKNKHKIKATILLKLCIIFTIMGFINSDNIYYTIISIIIITLAVTGLEFLKIEEN
jgi:hypothetical protein